MAQAAARLAPRIGLILLLIMLSFVVADDAKSMGRCGPRDPLIETLKTKFRESMVGYSMLDGQIVEMYRSDKGSWTLVVSKGAHISCIVLGGKNWTDVKPQRIAKGRPM